MMKIEGKTICVTGAAGFLGCHLCRKLVSQGAKVIALDNFSVGQRQNLREIEKELEIVEADVRDIQSLKNPIKSSQIAVHLAGIAMPRTCQQNLGLAFDVNVKGTANILSLCSDVERVIFLSSIMVYGEPRYLPIDDRHPLDGRDSYSITKIMSEYLLKAYHYVQGIPFTIIRNSNTFGPGQSADYLIPTFIIQGLTQKKIEIWDPKVIRDFLYVDDTVEAITRVLESEASSCEIMNLGSGQGVATGELADFVCRLLDTTWSDVKKPSPVSSKLISDITKIKALTGWEPKISLEEGLQRTIEYYKSTLAGVK